MRTITCDRCGKKVEGRQLGSADGWYSHSLYCGRMVLDLCENCEQEFNKAESMARKQYDTAIDYFFKSKPCPDESGCEIQEELVSLSPDSPLVKKGGLK